MNSKAFNWPLLTGNFKKRYCLATVNLHRKVSDSHKKHENQATYRVGNRFFVCRLRRVDRLGLIERLRLLLDLPLRSWNRLFEGFYIRKARVSYSFEFTQVKRAQIELITKIYLSFTPPPKIKWHVDLIFAAATKCDSCYATTAWRKEALERHF